MTTPNVNLTQRHSDFIQRVIAEGGYASASEVVREALRLLEQQQEEDRLKLQRLREAIQVGIDQMERGEFTEMPLDDVEGYLDGLMWKSDSSAA
jgi:antitoxin ParD1/3/4